MKNAFSPHSRRTSFTEDDGSDLSWQDEESHLGPPPKYSRHISSNKDSYSDSSDSEPNSEDEEHVQFVIGRRKYANKAEKQRKKLELRAIRDENRKKKKDKRNRRREDRERARMEGKAAKQEQKDSQKETRESKKNERRSNGKRTISGSLVSKILLGIGGLCALVSSIIMIVYGINSSSSGEFTSWTSLSIGSLVLGLLAFILTFVSRTMDRDKLTHYWHSKDDGGASSFLRAVGWSFAVTALPAATLAGVHIYLRTKSDTVPIGWIVGFCVLFGGLLTVSVACFNNCFRSSGGGGGGYNEKDEEDYW